LELDEDSRRTIELVDPELREGAVAARPLEEADEEVVEGNLRIDILAALVFLDVEDLCVVLDLDGDWEREEEKRLIILLVLVPDEVSDLVEDEGYLLVTTDRPGVVSFKLRVDDLNLEGITLLSCIPELLDVTDVCELGEYLLMLRDETSDFEVTPPVLLTRLEDLLATLELSRPLPIDVDLTRERALTVFSEE